eukprot:524254-Pelagomonas_calceolata.AAC.3
MAHQKQPGLTIAHGNSLVFGSVPFVQAELKSIAQQKQSALHAGSPAVSWCLPLHPVVSPLLSRCFGSAHPLSVQVLDLMLEGGVPCSKYICPKVKSHPGSAGPDAGGWGAPQQIHFSKDHGALIVCGSHTCADLILEVLDLMLEGGVPRADDLLLLRDFILSGSHHHDMYQPLDVWQQLHTLTMEVRTRVCVVSVAVAPHADHGGAYVCVCVSSFTH